MSLPITTSSLVCAATASLALAGPLTPPAGPVAPTPGPEPRIAISDTNTPGDADSLFKITKPGSYYLTGNITGAANKHGIEIVASGVTIDLNGFDLAGVPGMGSFDGVSATIGNLANIEIRNGSVRGWGGEGVDIGSTGALNCTVRDVRTIGNSVNGIFVGHNSTIIDCAASSNGRTGIVAGTGSIISRCSAQDNTLDGISVSNLGTISECTAFGNDANGISGGGGSTISQCTVATNILQGISAGSGCTVSRCTAYINSGAGIAATNGCTISGCTVQANLSDGILVSNQCLVMDNTCATNGNGGDGAGIHATGSDNRIEGNNCTGADRGIDVDAAGNIIIKNTCSGNTLNWTIVANNVVGPILNRTAPASAAISGDSAPDSTGSTHPNANFTY